MDTDNNDVCSFCNGSGYSKRSPVICGCETKICMRCEKNEGFLVHPYEQCDYCCGTGSIASASSVLNIPIKSRSGEKTKK